MRTPAMPEISHAHRWDLTPKEAVAVQRELEPLVREAPLDPDAVGTVAGLDVSVRGDRVRAAIVVLDAETLAVVDQAVWDGPVAFPYVPGLLSFREVPALVPALDRLTVTPDVYMLDAHGRAHPRRFGLACHLGVLLEAPALGVAKTVFVGAPDGELGEAKGAAVDLVHRGDVVGRVVRTRERVKPVYVSVGHRVTLRDAGRLALRLAVKYKLPQPTHLAHRLSYRGEL